MSKVRLIGRQTPVPSWGKGFLRQIDAMYCSMLGAHIRYCRMCRLRPRRILTDVFHFGAT